MGSRDLGPNQDECDLIRPNTQESTVGAIKRPHERRERKRGAPSCPVLVLQFLYDPISDLSSWYPATTPAQRVRGTESDAAIPPSYVRRSCSLQRHPHCCPR